MDIVTEIPSITSLFCNEGINFLVNGDRTISEIYHDNPYQKKLILKSIQERKKKEIISISISHSPEKLIRMLEKKHHQQILPILPILMEYGQYICKQYQKDFPEGEELCRIIKELKKEIIQQTYREEQILFPYILNLSEAFKNSVSCEQPKNIQPNFFPKLLAHAAFAWEKFIRLRQITDRYEHPSIQNKPIKYLFERLKEFENKFLFHLHLEINIMIPMAKQLEYIITGQGNEE